MKIISSLMTVSILVLGALRVDAQDLNIKSSLQPRDAMQLAQEQLPEMLGLIESEELEEFGFNTTDDLAQIKMGRVVYLTTAYDIKDLAESKKNVLEIQTMMLPMIVDNTVRSFVFISMEEGQWKVVGIGSKEYARDNDAFFNKIDDQASLIIAVPQVNEEFFNDMSGKLDAFQPIFRINEEIENRTFSVKEVVDIYSNSLISEDAVE